MQHLEENSASQNIVNAECCPMVPVLFKKQLKSWVHAPLTISDLVKKCENQLLTFRVSPKSSDDISWEGLAINVTASISEFVDWQSSETSDLDNSNPFYSFCKNDYWAYSSYNYMHFTFDDDSEILKAVNWGTFGLPEEPGNESAFWLGSMGAYTPCHYDSYGCNVVAQILGRKKWVLFPPEDSAFMYPSRIPYEESTVFSAVNVLNPDLSIHPLFKNSHPHIVILSPGDALFVPKHWWHFVVCMDDVTVSINNWIKLDSDHESRLEESVTRALMTSFIPCYEPKGESWLNLKEDLMSPDVTLDCLTAALNEWNKQNIEKFSTVILNESSNIMAKLPKTSTQCDVHCSSTKTSICHIFKHDDFQYVKPIPFSEWLPVDISTVSLSSELNLNDIINSFVHPDVISVICKNLKKAINKTE